MFFFFKLLNFFFRAFLMDFSNIQQVLNNFRIFSKQVLKFYAWVQCLDLGTILPLVQVNHLNLQLNLLLNLLICLDLCTDLLVLTIILVDCCAFQSVFEVNAQVFGANVSVKCVFTQIYAKILVFLQVFGQILLVVGLCLVFGAIILVICSRTSFVLYNLILFVQEYLQRDVFVCKLQQICARKDANMQEIVQKSAQIV